MLKDPTRRTNLGLAPNRCIFQYFTNPLGEDAKIAVQRLKAEKSKLKAERLKLKAERSKNKAEKLKKKAKKPKKKKNVTLPKSGLKPDSDVQPTPLPSKSNDLANTPKKLSKKARLAAQINRERPDIADVAETLAKAAKSLVEMTTLPVNRNPRENEKVKGKPDGKPEKKRSRKREETNGAEVAQNQPLLLQHLGDSGHGMAS